MNEIRLTLPIPEKALHPNARVHWAAKARAVRDARSTAWVEAKRVAWRSNTPRWERAETRATFYFATNRRRDGDGAAASLKAYWDGIADAGVIANDSGFVHHPPEMRVDKARPRLEITIREVTP